MKLTILKALLGPMALLALGGMRLGTLAAPNGATIGSITADVLGA